jgi:primosomal protein N' (replication factor Y)
MPQKPEEKLFLCDVVPLVPLPHGGRDAYSYLSEMPIPFGSLVRIPFGPRAIRGVAIRCEQVAAKPQAMRLKWIAGVIAESFITEHQYLLAKHISETCFTSLGRTLKHFLPAPVQERTKKNETKPERTRLVLSKKETAVVGAIGKSTKKLFFAEEDAETMLRVALGLFRKRKAKTQILVLFPELLALPDAKAFLVERVGEEHVALLHSRLSDGAFFSAWERIRKGDASIILGTRQALFAPFRNLSAIFVQGEEESVGYKQWDMSPRYDTRTEALELARLHDAKIVFASDAPSLELLGKIRGKSCVRLPEIIAPTKENIVFIDMRQERYKKNFSIFSETLVADIRWTAQQGKQTLLIGSRSGIDSFSVCTECKTVPRCPTCNRALRSTREGNFKCPTCAYRTATFPRCAKCGSLSFRNVGSGTEKIEREARKLFPGLAIVRIGEKTLSGVSFEKDTLALKEADILIGTASILHLPILPKAGFVAMMDADNLLSFPDFRADEKLLGIFLKSIALASKGWPYGKLLVQTFNPEKKPFSIIRDQGIPSVRESLMNDREALGYPPFASVWKLTAQDLSLEKSRKEAEREHGAFVKLSEKMDGVRISLITAPLLGRVRGRYRHHFIIRLSGTASLPEPIRKEIAKLPSSWMVEPDPLTLN